MAFKKVDKDRLRDGPHDPTLRFSTKEVAKMIGTTPRQIRYWIKAGAIVPTISGHRGESNIFTGANFVQAFLVSNMRNCGLETGTIKKLMDELRREQYFETLKYEDLTRPKIIAMDAEGVISILYYVPNHILNGESMGIYIDLPKVEKCVKHLISLENNKRIEPKEGLNENGGKP